MVVVQLALTAIVIDVFSAFLLRQIISLCRLTLEHLQMELLSPRANDFFVLPGGLMALVEVGMWVHLLC